MPVFPNTYILMSRQKILFAAQSQVNITESPARSNIQKYGDWYGMNGVKWCAIFVSWVYDQAGCRGCRLQVETRKGFHYCQGAYKHWKATGELTKIPQPGDIVLFDWKGDGHCDHTGIFESWKDKSTGRFYALEGNTEFGNNSDGGKVMRRERSISLVKAFVSPKGLNDTIAAPHSDTLQKGDRGSDVAFSQKLLWQLQYPIDVDGIFGPQTQAAVKQFQQQHFLKVTGTLSPDVLAPCKKNSTSANNPNKKPAPHPIFRKGIPARQ